MSLPFDTLFRGGDTAQFTRNKQIEYNIGPAGWAGLGDGLGGTRTISQFRASASFAGIVAPIQLIQGSTIISIIVHGDNTSAEWRIWKTNIDSGTTTDLTTGTIGTLKIVPDHLIDNNLFHYGLIIDNGELASQDLVFSSLITYIVPIDFADLGPT